MQRFPNKKLDSSHEVHRTLKRAGDSSKQTKRKEISIRVRYPTFSPGKLIVIFLDLSKAFDRVPHELVLTQLKKISGLNPFIINFIRSFITERSQFVCVAGRSSDLMSPNSGVPQGTIMGPPCFNLAYDDLKIDEDVNYHSECQMIKFADDNNPIIGVKNGRDCTEETLRMIYEWCESNNFLLNCSKTKQLTIKLKSTIQPIPSSIENQESLKILGLFFDTHLTFETHVNFICKKCAQTFIYSTNSSTMYIYTMTSICY